MSGRGEQAIEELERRMREDPESHPMMVTRRLATIAFLRLIANQTAAAQQAAMRLGDAAKKSMLPNTMVWPSYLHGVSSFQCGDFEAARSHFAVARQAQGRRDQDDCQSGADGVAV